ncbi:MAG: lipopolysaccharide heptosyltransferase II [Terriglobales bacterium]
MLAPNWVGDAVMCLPALAALAAQQPDWRWEIAARPAVAPVFTAAARAAAGATWTVAVLEGAPGVRQWRAMRRRWRGAPPLCVVVLPNSLYSALLARATGARQRVGYARDGRSALLTHPIGRPGPGETPPHEAFYYWELLRRAGLAGPWPARVEALRAPIAASAPALAEWAQRLPTPVPGGGRVAIHAGASFGHAKRWVPERFAAVAARLAAAGHAVLFIGSQQEAALATTLAQSAATSAGPSAAPIVTLAGATDLEGLLAVLAQCQLLIANDSGPMHLAAALGTPVLAVFGSTNARETHPLGTPGTWRLVQAPGIACSPCKRRECPIDHRCMTRVGVAEVTTAALDLLAQRQADLPQI